MSQDSLSFKVGELYSNEEIYTQLSVGNSGGIRVSLGDDKTPRRLVVMTQSHSRQSTSENPYSDRIEGDVRVYTAAGKEGDQALSGVNQRIPQQLKHRFPIYCFSRMTSRRESRGNPRQWKFVGLLQYLRYFPNKQIDVRGDLRSVWQFDLRVHAVEVPVVPNDDWVVGESVLVDATDDDDREIDTHEDEALDPAIVETERKRLLELHPEAFERTVRDVVAASGFRDVCVTKYSNDGGIDVTAFAGKAMWPLGDLQLQVQAKRWLHAVGRPDVANLRGSLAPFASGAVVTTGHFSKAAIRESIAEGKRPVVLIDGYRFASISMQVSL